MNSDFVDFLKLPEKYRVQYVVIGGYAVMEYSEPRATKYRVPEEEIFASKVQRRVSDTPVWFIDKQHLLRLKETTARPHDLIDAEKLKRFHPELADE